MSPKPLTNSNVSIHYPPGKASQRPDSGVNMSRARTGFMLQWPKGFVFAMIRLLPFSYLLWNWFIDLVSMFYPYFLLSNEPPSRDMESLTGQCNLAQLARYQELQITDEMLQKDNAIRPDSISTVFIFCNTRFSSRNLIVLQKAQSIPAIERIVRFMVSGKLTEVEDLTRQRSTAELLLSQGRQSGLFYTSDDQLTSQCIWAHVSR